MGNRIQNGDAMTGIELIAAERQRQIDKEGFFSEHDDEHEDEQLAIAAACYAMPLVMQRLITKIETEDISIRGECPVWGPVKYAVPELWPESWSAVWWNPKDRISDLVKAGALIAAEIDRLQRIEK